MWARRDWHDYYTTIQNVVVIFTVLFFAIQADRIRKYSKEEKDELAVQNLRRAEAVGFKIMIVAAIVIAFACAVTFLDGMLMYGKEARNGKQEIDRQHHTIPNHRKKRLKDKQNKLPFRVYFDY